MVTLKEEKEFVLTGLVFFLVVAFLVVAEATLRIQCM